MIKFMPDHDPLEELFRRSAGRMEQRPGLRNWRRVEQRLDARTQGRNRRHQSFLKPWYFAAAAVALVVIIALGVSRNGDFGANASILAQQPESIEELDLIPSVQSPVAAYQPIPEGSSRQFLVIRNSQLPKLLPAPKYRL